MSLELEPNDSNEEKVPLRRLLQLSDDPFLNALTADYLDSLSYEDLVELVVSIPGIPEEFRERIRGENTGETNS